MDKKERDSLRAEAEKDVLTAKDILAIRRAHEKGYTNENIGGVLGVSEETVSAALSRGIQPVAEEKEGDDDDGDGEA